MDHVALAADFAEKGFYVFPLYAGSNNQRIKPYGWALNEVEPEHREKVIKATKDVEYVKQWPKLVKEKYNSEVVSYGVLGLDCVIIDIDMKNGKNGVSQFHKLIATNNIPKPIMVTFTKSGGLHAYYRRPEKLKNAHVKTLANVQINGVQFDGLDLRGNGGFVVGPDLILTPGSKATPGKYCITKINRVEENPEFPEEILVQWIRNTLHNDLDNMMFDYGPDPEDFKAQIRRGVIPKFIPAGARNDSFYIFVNVLHSKAVPIDVAREMCYKLRDVCEDPETFELSVNIEELLSRVYVVKKDNPYDVAVDLIDKGLFQLTNYKSKIHYAIFEDNPYIASRGIHDESTMKTLMMKYQSSVQLANGKTKSVNPFDIVPKIMHDENRADAVGFLPGMGQVFTLHNDPGAKRYLNTFKRIPIPKSPDGLDFKIWDEFCLIVSRLFGPEGSDEYTLGMDFLAWLLQKPGYKVGIAPFIMSYHRGVGKSLLFDVIIQILGTSKVGDRQGRLMKLDEITGRFFDPSGTIVNLIDEVQFPVHKDVRKESVTFWRHLKNIITVNTVPIEIKGGAVYQVPNTAGLMLAGNTGSHFPIEEMDRRLWIIDANPPVLKMGEADRLFNITRQGHIGVDEHTKYVHTLRYQLFNRKIEMDLESIRAPMTEIKRELFMNSLTDTEEWFVDHFETADNLFAATPIISKSAFVYVVETDPKLMGSKWRENVDAFFRDMKRRGYLRPIRIVGSSESSRAMKAPIIGSDGKIYESNRREVLYTTRDHGSFDDEKNDTILQAYMQNIHTIKRFKGQMKDSIGRQEISDNTSAQDLLA